MSDDSHPSVPARPSTSAALPDDLPLAAPAYGWPQRALFAVMAVMCLVVAAILGISGSWLLAASMVLFGGGMGYFAVTGRRPADPALAPASRHFHELANPARPLTADDMKLPGTQQPTAPK
ncbi:MAG TPA: hypothetical protein VFS20_13525 [Longimicrobium sp.]|nr:hypothetical protein [Longimicrobium sp.]